MNFAFNIRAENKTAEPILKLWDKISLFEREPSMHSLKYAPHFTFGIYENIALETVKSAFNATSKNLTTLKITFSEISYFDAEKLVLWLKAHNEDELHAIHQIIHKHLPQKSCHEYYRPKVWQPHCTLGMDIRPAKREAAIEFANNPIQPFTVEFDVFDCVSFMPVKIIKETKLL